MIPMLFQYGTVVDPDPYPDRSVGYSLLRVKGFSSLDVFYEDLGINK